jgi:predicted RNA binding protein YcfA (HicA-like mRNA interferase family)
VYSFGLDVQQECHACAIKRSESFHFKKVLDHLGWFELRQKKLHQSWKHEYHSANALTLQKPSCLTVGK